jgi:hypothetical protein
MKHGNSTIFSQHKSINLRNRCFFSFITSIKYAGCVFVASFCLNEDQKPNIGESRDIVLFNPTLSTLNILISDSSPGAVL